MVCFLFVRQFQNRSSRNLKETVSHCFDALLSLHFHQSHWKNCNAIFARIIYDLFDTSISTYVLWRMA